MKLTKQEKIERKEHFIKVLRNMGLPIKKVFGINTVKTGEKYRSTVYAVDLKGKIKNVTLYVGVIGECKMSRHNRDILSNDNPANFLKGVIISVFGSGTVYSVN